MTNEKHIRHHAMKAHCLRSVIGLLLPLLGLVMAAPSTWRGRIHV
jgi:hypothetical protein